MQNEDLHEVYLVEQHMNNNDIKMFYWWENLTKSSNKSKRRASVCCSLNTVGDDSCNVYTYFSDIGPVNHIYIATYINLPKTKVVQNPDGFTLVTFSFFIFRYFVLGRSNCNGLVAMTLSHFTLLLYSQCDSIN